MPKAIRSPKKKKTTAQSRRVDAGDYTCPDCGSTVRSRGKGSHNKACKPYLLQVKQEFAAANEQKDRTEHPSRPPHNEEDDAVALADVDMHDNSMERSMETHMKASHHLEQLPTEKESDQIEEGNQDIIWIYSIT